MLDIKSVNNNQQKLQNTAVIKSFAIVIIKYLYAYINLQISAMWYVQANRCKMSYCNTTQVQSQAAQSRCTVVRP